MMKIWIRPELNLNHKLRRTGDDKRASLKIVFGHEPLGNRDAIQKYWVDFDYWLTPNPPPR